jgi:hypothetical protein
MMAVLCNKGWLTSGCCILAKRQQLGTLHMSRAPDGMCGQLWYCVLVCEHVCARMTSWVFYTLLHCYVRAISCPDPPFSLGLTWQCAELSLTWECGGLRLTRNLQSQVYMQHV